MQNDKRIICILPAYNAERTLAKTLGDATPGVVDLFVLVDDCSSDGTVEVARNLSQHYPLRVIRHEQNRGYGGNQKTCFREALAENADVVVMLHPDYQYEPKLLGAMTSMVTSEVYDIALGSRILGKGALLGGMPLYKYFFNRVLTLIENICIGQKLSEYHTGYRAYSRRALESIDYESFSNDFVFDNQILVEAHAKGFRMGELSVPTKYFDEASSINFFRSIVYGLGVLRCSARGFLNRYTSKKLCELPD